MEHDFLNGLPPALQGDAIELEGALEDAAAAVADVGDTDLELAGPEEQREEYISDDTGAKRKIRFPWSKKHSVKAKRAHSAPASSGGHALAQRVTRAEQAVNKLSVNWKKFLKIIDLSPYGQ